MDSLTHIVLGAATGQVIMGNKVGNKALFWGAIAGSLPDFDTIITPLLQPVEALFFHRGPSHSILFAIIAAPIMGLLATKIHRDKNFRQWTLMSLIAILMHSTIDIFNTYGTALLLPFSNTRLAFDSIGIIDIMFLIPIVILLIIILFKPIESPVRSKLSWGILLFASLFVGLSVVNKVHIERRVTAQLKEQGVNFYRIKTAPLPLTNFFWLAVAEDSTGYHYGYISNFDQKSIEFKYINRNEKLLGEFSKHNKIKDLIRFTDGFYKVDQKEDGSLWLYDLRFGSMGFDDEQWFVMNFEISGPTNAPDVSRSNPNRKINGKNMKLYWNRLRRDL
jgi:inner membrane protein